MAYPNTSQVLKFVSFIVKIEEMHLSIFIKYSYQHEFIILNLIFYFESHYFECAFTKPKKYNFYNKLVLLHSIRFNIW